MLVNHKPIIDQGYWGSVHAKFKILMVNQLESTMVIMRCSKKRKDGTRHRIEYYACGNWKNKGTTVCHSNAINVNKANDYVFGKLSELLNNDKLIKDIVTNINSTRKAMVEPSKEELERVLKELEKIEAKKKKVFEAYEEEIISKSDFSDRMAEIKNREKTLQHKANKLKTNTLEDNVQEVSYKFVKGILSSFGKMLSKVTTREQQKRLLHMLISKITINKDRDIESIELNINNNLIMYLNNGGEPSPDMEEVLLLILFQEEL